VSRHSRMVGGGSCFQRGNGRWVGALDQGWSEDGKRSKRLVYGPTQAAVLAKLRALSRNRDDGVVQAGRMPTVGAYLERWVEETARVKVRPSTFVSYSVIVRAHLIPSLGKVRLDKLTPDHVQKMLNAKLAGGLSPRRVQYIRAVLRVSLAGAVARRQLSLNVAGAGMVATPRVERHKVRPMTAGEAQAILDAFEGHRLAGLVTVALGLGLRLGEALGLQWSEVNFERGQLRVVATLQRLKGSDGIRRWELRPPKSEESNRTLPLPSSVAEALQGERSRQRLAQLAAGPAWHESGFVFTGRTGEPWSENGALHAFQGALAVAGLPRMRLHDLRHGTATLLLAQGVPARVVMEILGHSQISMTLNTYSHVIPELMGGAAQAIDSAFARS